MYYFKNFKAAPQILTIFNCGWKITLMLMAVLFMFTACEVDNLAVEAPEKMEESMDFSSMSKQEWITYYQGLDRNKLTNQQTDLIVKKNEVALRPGVRASCTLEVKIDRTVGSATTYVLLITKEGNSVPDVKFLSEGVWTSTITIDDTKAYDIVVQPMTNVNNDEDFWVRLNTNNYYYSFSMLTWDKDRKAYWLGFDTFDCS